MNDQLFDRCRWHFWSQLGWETYEHCFQQVRNKITHIHLSQVWVIKGDL